MCEEEKVIAFVDGMVTDEKNLTDEMYEKACLHDEKGAWQMIFGVNTLPKYRRQGYAEKLLRYAINDARAQDREGLVLTCKDKLVHYYEKFGFLMKKVKKLPLKQQPALSKRLLRQLLTEAPIIILC